MNNVHIGMKVLIHGDHPSEHPVKLVVQEEAR